MSLLNNIIEDNQEESMTRERRTERTHDEIIRTQYAPMHQGSLLYSELTLFDRLDELKKTAEEKTMWDKGTEKEKTGLLLETKYAPWGFTREYFLSENKVRIKTTKKNHSTILSKEENPEGIKLDTFTLLGNSLHIGNNFFNIEKFKELKTVDNYFLNMEKLIPEIEHNYRDNKNKQTIKTRIAAHLVGFGNAALENHDVKTAIRAYNMAQVFDIKNEELYGTRKIETYLSKNRCSKDKTEKVITALRGLHLISSHK